MSYHEYDAHEGYSSLKIVRRDDDGSTASTLFEESYEDGRELEVYVDVLEEETDGRFNTAAAFLTRDDARALVDFLSRLFKFDVSLDTDDR